MDDDYTENIYTGEIMPRENQVAKENMKAETKQTQDPQL